MQKLLLIGNLGRGPEVKVQPTGYGHRTVHSARLCTQSEGQDTDIPKPYERVAEVMVGLSR
jgi:hypothetical protein